MERGAILFILLLSCSAVTVMADDRLSAAIGKGLFRRAWVPAPSSTLSNDGLGPLFNERSCLSCHQGLDRMPLSASGGVVRSPNLVLRFSDDAGKPDPVYGVQLQTSAVQEHRPEGRVALRDGRPEPSNLNYGPLAPSTRYGGRDAPMLRGLGLLERVPDEAILAMADPEDRDGDGVRGRANVLPDGRIGRFGWKAASPRLPEQIATAFHLDLGMSTPLHPRPEGDCTPSQRDCAAGPHGGDDVTPEIHDEIVAMLAAYLASIEPPDAPAGDHPGRELFVSTGCAACHRPELPMRGGETVRPFTDLLLHDLGPELDGGATEPGVAPTEWRTAPLWGVSRTLQRGAGLLHDGRARSIEEAIAFHGGEASSARARFGQLPDADRKRLLDYVGGL